MHSVEKPLQNDLAGTSLTTKLARGFLQNALVNIILTNVNIPSVDG